MKKTTNFEKGVIIFLLLILLIMLISIVYTNKKRSNFEVLGDEIYLCNNDSDCISVPPKNDCNCNNGGYNIAINKDYLLYWEEYLKRDNKPQTCLAVMRCFGEPRCIEGICKIVEKDSN